MPKRTKDYKESLIEGLKNPEEAAAYLNSYLDNADGKETEESFLLALRDVATAYGISNLSEETDLGRESLYKTLSKNGNPKLTTLLTLLDAMGLKLSVDIKEEKRKAS
jgi:probable addiction module antidote protein